MTRHEWRLKWQDWRFQNSEFVVALRDRPAFKTFVLPGFPLIAIEASRLVRLARAQAEARR